MLGEYLTWIKEFLKDLGFSELITQESFQIDSIILLLSLGLLGSLLTTIWRLILISIRKQREKRLKKDLHPYFSVTDIRMSTQYYVSTHFQSNPPSQHHELIQSHKVTARQRLIPFFLNVAFKPGKDDQRFYIILAGSGMGKTTFMINLYMRYITKMGRGKFNIKLLPLGYPNILKRIEKIPDQENTILLLDGLDEDTNAVKNYQKRMQKILSKVQDFRVVVFTCRTQFFPSEEEEPRETKVVRFGSQQGFQTFAKMYISPFNEKDIKRFLDRRYSLTAYQKKKKALNIIEHSPNLMVRPMILGYIDDLLEEPTTYNYTSNLYQVMIRKWIEREANRVAEERRDTFRDELHRFSREVALNIYRNRKHRNGLYIGEKDILELASKHQIQLEEIEMKSRSLLNRDMMGQYKFAHKSILEYFLAVEAVEDPGFASSFSFEGMDQARLFFDETCLSRNTLPLFKKSKGLGQLTLIEGQRKDVSEATPQDLKRIIGIKFETAKDIDSLRPLRLLRHLDINGTQVRDLAAVEQMEILEDLFCKDTPIDNLKPLLKLQELRKLYLDNTRIKDLDPIKDLGKIHLLSFSNTLVDNIDSLYYLFEMENLVFHHTKVKDLNPVRKLRKLKTLIFHNTQVNSLSPLRELEDMQTLSFGYTNVNNLSPIRSMEKLQNLSFYQTPVPGLKPLKGIESLKHLNFDRCPIDDIEVVGEFKNLESLSMKRTPVTKLDSLKGLNNLEKLHIDGCNIESLAPLKSLTGLKEISLKNIP